MRAVDGWDPGLLLKVERCDAALVARLANAVPAAERRVRELGGAVALASLDRPNTLFNRALGLGPDDGERIAEIAAFYAALDVPPRVDVCPQLNGPELREALRGAGLVPGGFPFFSRRVLIGAVSNGDGSLDDTAPALRGRASLLPVDVTIERAGEADVDAFVAISESAWPLEAAAHRRALAEARALHALGQYRYFARVAGQRVAIASMDVRDGIAYLSHAVTLEPARGHGCQTALLRRRLADAAAAGAETAFTVVAADTASERNMLRAGLQHAYDRETWLPPDWTQHPFYRNAG